MSASTASPLVTDPRRTIVLEGAHNVRDLGGYRIADGRTIAWRRLLRGDGLHGLTADDLAVLAPLGLRTVIDLRRHEEIAERGAFPVERLPVDLVHLPVMDSTWMSVAIPDFSTHDDPDVAFLTWAYADMLVEGGLRFGAAVRHLPARARCRRSSTARPARTGPACSPPCCSPPSASTTSSSWPTTA